MSFCMMDVTLGWRDSSVGVSFASHAGDPGSNPGGGFVGFTHERGIDHQLIKVILHQVALLIST